MPRTARTAALRIWKFPAALGSRRQELRPQRTSQFGLGPWKSAGGTTSTAGSEAIGGQTFWELFTADSLRQLWPSAVARPSTGIPTRAPGVCLKARVAVCRRGARGDRVSPSGTNPAHLGPPALHLVLIRTQRSSKASGKLLRLISGGRALSRPAEVGRRRETVNSRVGGIR